MEDGKRLENLSWRLWNRETFCCAPETQARFSPHRAFPPRKNKDANIPVPQLSSSLDSIESDDSDDGDASSLPTQFARPELRRSDSAESRSRGREKHITPIDLEKIVISIQEKKSLEPLSPSLLPALEPAKMGLIHGNHEGLAQAQTQKETSTSHSETTPQTPNLLSSNNPLESSASTVASSESTDSRQGHSDSSSTEMSTHSIIRGFQPGGAPSSYRSQTHLAPAQPTPILKTSPSYKQEQPKKKAAMFTLGSSSGEEESSLDSHMQQSMSSLSAALSKPLGKKLTSFKEDIVSRVQTSPVFESDDEEDEDVSESVIEDDEDSSDWEDEGESGQSSVEDKSLFRRVDSRPNLASHRSLLTSLMHEPDRAKAMQNAAMSSRSTPALRRSRTTSPNGPSVGSSPQLQPQPEVRQLGVPAGLEMTRAKPIIMTTSNTHNVALSPRTTRRNMLSTELTESLRKNLLWERQHKSSQNIAALKRRHTSTDVKNLKQYPEPKPVLDKSKDSNPKTFSNDYFHAGLQEYHAKGW